MAANMQGDPEFAKYTVMPEKALGKVQQVLQPNEVIEFALRGIGATHSQGMNVRRGDQGTQVGHPWFLVTNRRLLLASTGLMSFETRSFTWDQLNSVELQQGIMDDHVVITGMSSTENWTFWKKVRPLTLQAVQLAQKLIDQSRNRPQQAAAPAQADPVAELKMRLVRGEITEEQYNKMLSILKGS